MLSSRYWYWNISVHEVTMARTSRKIVFDDMAESMYQIIVLDSNTIKSLFRHSP